ncbi:MAG: hypothetical protein K2X29_15070, partial [Candidatus Obscuribacterales bacterium]|nr:hypothetical protein [Candidatus Obscuribacterales bacterium]
MVVPKYEYYDYESYRFVFKYDDDFSEMLHIWVRHLKTEEDAVRIWLEGAEESWNEKFQRYETYTDEEGLYWIWLQKNKVIMV